MLQAGQLFVSRPCAACGMCLNSAQCQERAQIRVTMLLGGIGAFLRPADHLPWVRTEERSCS